jgi:hypothetical protein
MPRRNPQKRRNDMLHALLWRGYTRSNLVPMTGDKNFTELLSPEGKSGKPLTGCLHYIMVGDDGTVHMLRDGASLDFMIELPERTTARVLSEYQTHAD